MMGRWIWFLVGVGLAVGSTHAADTPPISIADLAAYHAAITGKLDPSTVRPVSFRELWDHPEAYQGQPVRVEGKLARLFRQPGVGQFPPLAEAWITSPRGEPTCIIFPTQPGQPAPSSGDQVEFSGTFLRQIAYQGGDTKRVAPLIVGPALPDVRAGSTASAEPFGPIFGSDHAVDWGIGLVVSLGVLGMLARRHWSRPIHAAPPVGPPPAFLDGGSDWHEPGDDHDVDD